MVALLKLSYIIILWLTDCSDDWAGMHGDHTSDAFSQLASQKQSLHASTILLSQWYDHI